MTRTSKEIFKWESVDYATLLSISKFKSDISFHPSKSFRSLSIQHYSLIETSEFPTSTYGLWNP